MQALDSLIIGLYSFGRSYLGIISKPYETYRRIIEHGTLWECIPVACFASLYFVIASLVKTWAFRPFLLTKRFILLADAAAIGFTLIVVVLWSIGRLVGGRGELKRVVLGWSYTLIPTILWFFTTSILYVLLPPPRTTHLTGILFSVLYLTFSCALFFWKFMLAYLTLRFALRLDFMRIIIVAIVTSPIIAWFSVVMYRLGIYRVPFL